ncbi:uncharacterized protein A4U43_C05F28890 [Asparagus officinalis]|uniref:Secreted protein n=1 Tax=Asparagus officinalis TaxID=4686 RepID=A0A5P1EVV9_ASPOF|nr:uncharacterized protein A4U43_C05F28890 [Asparagus officinalis]
MRPLSTETAVLVVVAHVVLVGVDCCKLSKWSVTGVPEKCRVYIQRKDCLFSSCCVLERGFFFVPSFLDVASSGLELPKKLAPSFKLGTAQAANKFLTTYKYFT